jgi:polysaccharide pyruvyl transferase CsaB
MTKKQGVTICGFYGNSNLGDEAMLVGMLTLLRRVRSDLSFTVFSNDPVDTKTRYAIKAINRLSRKRKLHRMMGTLQNRYFILGGGDLLRDSATTSIATAWLKPLQQAITMRRRTCVLGISVGEIWMPETKALIPQVLNRVDLIGVRDVRSQAKLEELGVKKKIHVMSDLALETVPNAIAQPSKSENQSLQIGISMRHLSGRGPKVNVDLYPTVQKEMATIVDTLIEQYGATVHLLPFRTFRDKYHATDGDYVSALSMLRYSRHSAQCVVHRYIESVEALNQLMGSLDLVIGMRLHSIILASGAGVPVIAAQYDPKVEGYMAEIGQSERSIPLEQFEAASVLPIVSTILNDLPGARQSVAAGLNHYRRRMASLHPALVDMFAS